MAFYDAPTEHWHKHRKDVDELTNKEPRAQLHATAAQRRTLYRTGFTVQTLPRLWIPATALRFGSGGGDPEVLALEGPLAPRTHSHTQHGLPADELISFRVRARNRVGWGPWSKPLKVPTPSAMPLRLSAWDSRLSERFDADRPRR